MSPREVHSIRPAPKALLLDGLASRDREIVLSAATRRKFAAGTVISAQGMLADRLYLLVKGCVRFFYTTAEGQKILLIWMGPGDVFGGAALVATPSSYLISAETVKDSEVLVWDRHAFRGFTERFPRILDNALVIALEYVDWYMMAHVALSCHTARERLARVLLGLSTAIGKKVPDGIEIDVSNEDLASAANITPYTTSRMISGWQKSRAISKRRGKVILRSPERLLLKVARLHQPR
jgi:CRP-like cAMP-binding protein